MPQLSDILRDRKQKTFVKKNYRPWDLSGSGNVSSKVNQAVATSPLIDNTVTDSTINLDIANAIPASVTEVPPPDLDNKLDNERVTLSQHSDNIQISKSKPRDNIQVTISEHLDNNIDNHLDNNSYPEIIKKIAGIQENIFFYIVEVCNARGTFETGNLLTNDIASAANCTYGSAKMSLKRLIDKGLIIRKTGKRAKGGHINLSITKEIRMAALEVKREKSLRPMIHQQVIQQRKQLDNISDNNVAYSSSYINKTTTSELPEEWQKINIAPLAAIGFTEKHLVDVYVTKLTTPDIVQESINHFAYGLEHNATKYKAYPDPLNVLIGCLRKGKAWSESNYVSLQEKAIQELLARRRAEQERMNALEAELIHVEFLAWKKALSADRKKQILPERFFGPEDSHLKVYFTENVWTQLRSQLALENP